jgi:hypothetical protein
MNLYLAKQLRHQVQTLSWRTKIEVLILGGIVFIFLSGRLADLFRLWQNEYGFSSLRLTLFTVHIIIFLMLLSGPFVIAYLLPRQKALRIYFTLPVTYADQIKLLGFYTAKYQVLYALLMIPLAIALLVSAGWPYMMLGLVIFFVYGAGFLILQNILLTRSGSVYEYIRITLAVSVLYIVSWICLYWFTGLIWLFELLLIPAMVFLVVRLGRGGRDRDLEQVLPVSRDEYIAAQSKLPGASFNIRGGSSVFYAMFMKEWLGMWRNPRYRRLKWSTFLFYLAAMVALLIHGPEYTEIWMLVLTLIVMWLHYSTAFNDKYVRPDPDWYIKNIPVRFSQLWSTKFFSEFVYVFLLLSVFWIFLLINGLTFQLQLNLTGIGLIFAFFVLSSMITFQLMFYDDPRLAGYAYHFTIIFILIMSLNFHLVGPVIGILLMFFYLYKSYSYFKS